MLLGQQGQRGRSQVYRVSLNQGGNSSGGDPEPFIALRVSAVDSLLVGRIGIDFFLFVQNCWAQRCSTGEIQTGGSLPDLGMSKAAHIIVIRGFGPDALS